MLPAGSLFAAAAEAAAAPAGKITIAWVQDMLISFRVSLTGV